MPSSVHRSSHRSSRSSEHCGPVLSPSCARVLTAQSRRRRTMGRRAPPNPPGRTLPAISTSARTAALMSSKSPVVGKSRCCLRSQLSIISRPRPFEGPFRRVDIDTSRARPRATLCARERRIDVSDDALDPRMAGAHRRARARRAPRRARGPATTRTARYPGQLEPRSQAVELHEL